MTPPTTNLRQRQTPTASQPLLREPQVLLFLLLLLNLRLDPVTSTRWSSSSLSSLSSSAEATTSSTLFARKPKRQPPPSPLQSTNDDNDKDARENETALTSQTRTDILSCTRGGVVPMRIQARNNPLLLLRGGGDDDNDDDTDNERALPTKKPKPKTNQTTSKAKRKKSKAATHHSTKSKRSSSSSSSPANTKRTSDTVRRIQREWKDVIDAGMGYDWQKQRPILPKQQPQQPQSNATAETQTQPPPQQQQQHVWIGPLHKSNLLVWHFSFLGLPGSPFEGGIYHGRLILPANYPAQPPKVQLWTPSGRFLVKHNICLSASHYHPEAWNAAAWTVQTLVQSLRLHMLASGQEIGGIAHATHEEKARLAKNSRSWRTELWEPSASSSAKSRHRRPIVANHNLMIRQGLFPKLDTDDDCSLDEGLDMGVLSMGSETDADHDDDDDLKEILYYEKLLQQANQQKKPRKPKARIASASPSTRVSSRRTSSSSSSSGLLKTLTSPIRLALWGFLILFVWLNRP